jgi:hypothetical protein
MTGIEIAAASYLFRWAKDRLRPVAERAGDEADAATGRLLDRLHALVADRLGARARELTRLDREAAEGRDEPGATTGTLVASTLRAEMEDDPAFADRLTALVEELRAAQAGSGTGAGDVHNSVTGGTINGPLVQARDIGSLSFGAPAPGGQGGDGRS